MSGLSFPDGEPESTKLAERDLFELDIEEPNPETTLGAIRRGLSAALELRSSRPLMDALFAKGLTDAALAKALREIHEIAGRVDACYSATLPDGTSLLMLSDAAIQLDVGREAVFRFEC